MYKSNLEEGYLAGRLYRSPAEIKRDIRKIKDEINSVNELFNIRELVDAIITEGADGDITRIAAAAAELYDSAEEALSTLRLLEESLDELRAELVLVYEEG